MGTTALAKYDHFEELAFIDEQGSWRDLGDLTAFNSPPIEWMYIPE